jgi:hypothetical protein
VLFFSVTLILAALAQVMIYDQRQSATRLAGAVGSTVNVERLTGLV